MSDYNTLRGKYNEELLKYIALPIKDSVNGLKLHKRILALNRKLRALESKISTGGKRCMVGNYPSPN